MIPLYAANSSIDAHLLKGLLEQRGIEVQIIGEFLQGAMGELPASGLIKVLVPEEQFDDALDALREFEANMTAGSRWF